MKSSSFVKNIFKNKEGSMFLFVMIFGFVAFTTVTLGITSYVVFESKAAKQEYRHSMALTIAEAGIDYYRWHLNNYPEDYYDGHGSESFGSHFHDYLDKDGNVVGTFSVTIVPPIEGTHVVEVRSTGWSIDNPSSKRTIKAYFGYESFSDSSFVVKADMSFSATSFVHGKVFANGCVQFDGTSDSWIQSAKGEGACSGNNGVYGAGGPQEFWKYGLPEKSFASISSDFSTLLGMANESNGLNLGHSNKGWHLSFKSDGTFDLNRVDTVDTTSFYPYYEPKNDINSETFQGNKIIPANGVIYSDSNIWVDGIVNGRVTVVADTSGHNIYIPANLTYNEKHSDDVIGLLAYHDVVIPYDVPDDMEIDGVLLSKDGAIHRGYYDQSHYGSSYIRNSLTIFGSQIEFLRGGFKYGTAPNYSSGFVSTSYTYDGNLLYQPPIGIPVTPNYKLISWQEVPPGECDAYNPCPIALCGGKTSIAYSGQRYDLAVIGNQCWFAQNLNVGTKLASGSTVPSDNNKIEKWCYDNDDANCNNYGGLYTWAEAMQLDPSCNTSSCVGFVNVNHQGICPVGWHIPTDEEYKALESFLGVCSGSGTGCIDAIGWRGTDQGTQLKSGGSSGFNFLLAGYNNMVGSFVNQDISGLLWSASENYGAYTWARFFYSSEAGVNRYFYDKKYGYSVRCLRSPTPCNGESSISYAGQNYNLAEIGDQCWIADNLNVGDMIDSSVDPSSSSVEKWCYDNNSTSCTSQGGLYTWAEAMQLDPSCNNGSCANSINVNHQGICPAGYHIPTDVEIKTLEMSLGMTQEQANLVGVRGTDEGTQLKIGGTSGFGFRLAGYYSDSFYNSGSYGYMWSASEITNTNKAWSRTLSALTSVDRSSGSKAFGYSVRCLKTISTPNNPSSPSSPIIISLVASSSTVQINWTSVSGASYYTVSSTIPGQEITTVYQPSYTFNDLTPATNYSFQVQATDDYSQSSSFSSVSSTTSLLPDPPATPVIISNTPSSSSIIINWDAVFGADYYTIFVGLPNQSQTVIIGTNTDSQSQPISRNWDYSTAEFLYLKSELGSLNGNISSLAFYKASGNTGVTIEDVTIYLKHTTATILSSGSISMTGYIQVYSGAFPNTASSGWSSVNFNTPFAYDGTSNLQILVVKGYQAKVGTPPSYRFTSTGANRASNYKSKYYQSDTPWSVSSDSTATVNRSNIQLGYYTGDIFGSIIFTTTTLDTSYNFTGLSPNTMYHFQMSATDAYSQTSASSAIYSATTLP